MPSKDTTPPQPRLAADLLVAARARSQWGVLSHAELSACGLSSDAIARRVRRGRLHRLHRGVYAVGHAAPPWEGHLLAAVKACGPAAVVSHFAAAALWDILDRDDRHLEVTLPGTSTRVHRGIVVHRSRTLEAMDVTRHRGFRVTTPARTLLDLAAILDERQLRRAVSRAQSLQRVNVRQLADTSARRMGAPGRKRLARLIAGAAAPTRSALEDAVLTVMLDGGLERPDINVPLTVRGRRVVPDFRWAAQRLIVEADSVTWHDNPTARADDAERQALLEASGERVIRVTWEQALTRTRQTHERILAAGAPQA